MVKITLSDNVEGVKEFLFRVAYRDLNRDDLEVAMANWFIDYPDDINLVDKIDEVLANLGLSVRKREVASDLLHEAYYWSGGSEL